MCYECDAKDQWCNDPKEVENRAKKVKCEEDKQLCIESYARKFQTDVQNKAKASIVICLR